MLGPMISALTAVAWKFKFRRYNTGTFVSGGTDAEVSLTFVIGEWTIQHLPVFHAS